MAEKIKCDCGITFEIEKGQTHCNYCGIKISDIGKKKSVDLSVKEKTGLFSRKTDEQAAQEIFEKYGLDINNYDTNRIKKENYKNLERIAQDISENKFIKMGINLWAWKPDKVAMLGYLSALVNQNWILIRQNELIIRLLEKK